MQSFIKEHMDKQALRLSELYLAETYDLHTINLDAFERYKTQEAEILNRARYFMRLRARSPENWEKEMKPPEKMTEEEKAKESKEMAAELAKMGEDPFRQEMDVAAYVRGYYLTAALRFVDSVALSINSRLFREVVEKLDLYLDQKLGIIGASGKYGDISSEVEKELTLYPTTDRNVYDRLMSEDDATARKRDVLKDEKSKFEKAAESISELERASINVNDMVDVENFDGFPDMTSPRSGHTMLDEV